MTADQKGIMKKPISIKSWTPATKYIFKHFITPLVKSVVTAEDAGFEQILDLIFNADHRHTKSYRIIDKIEHLPGDYKVTPNLLSKSGGRRKFFKTWGTTVVFDSRFPSRISMEFYKDDESFSYQLTAAEFSSIVNLLEEIR